MDLLWLKIFIGDLAVQNERFRDENGAIDFAALGREEYEFRRAIILGDFSNSERAKETYERCKEEFKQRSRAGKENALKRWGKATPSDEEDVNAMPANRQAIIDFATSEGLDIDDACECWYASRERDGKTADGKNIINWKRYVKKWCNTRKSRRAQ
jgi:hypothetical protein